MSLKRKRGKLQLESTKILLDIYRSIEDVKTNIKLLHEKLDFLIENFQKKTMVIAFLD